MIVRICKRCGRGFELLQNHKGLSTICSPDCPEMVKVNPPAVERKVREEAEALWARLKVVGKKAVGARVIYKWSNGAIHTGTVNRLGPKWAEIKNAETGHIDWVTPKNVKLLPQSDEEKPFSSEDYSSPQEEAQSREKFTDSGGWVVTNNDGTKKMWDGEKWIPW
jgi:hypothetical protein